VEFKAFLDRNLIPPNCKILQECRERAEEAKHLRSFSVQIFSTSCVADIDECAEGTSGCSDICRNDLGSFHCDCPPGFQLADDHKSCKGSLRFIIFHCRKLNDIYIISSRSKTIRLKVDTVSRLKIMQVLYIMKLLIRILSIQWQSFDLNIVCK
jgi:hypothetical protein